MADCAFESEPTESKGGGTREFLRPIEIAKIFGVGAQKVRDWIESGELEGANIADPGKLRPRWVSTRQAVDEFYRSRLAVKPHAPRRKRPRALDYEVPD